MTELIESDFKRRDVLKRGVGATGALVAGGTALSGTAVAKRGGTGFIRTRGDAERGDTFTVKGRVTFADDDVAVECEANNKPRSIYTKYSIEGEINDFLWLKGEDPLTRVTFRVNKVRDCGALTTPEEPRGQEVDKVTFSPAKP